jgi:ribonuclease P protein component
MDSKVAQVTKATQASRAVKSKTGRAIDTVIQQGERSHSQHFALHWLRLNPPTPPTPLASLTSLVSETDTAPISLQGSKNTQIAFCAFVVSKRNAKHAARRNLIRRIWREALQRLEARAPAGAKPNPEPASDDMRIGTHPRALLNCVVRLTKPFDKHTYKSAASTLLATQIASEAASLTAALAIRSPTRLKTRTPSKPNTNEPTQTPGGLSNKA